MALKNLMFVKKLGVSIQVKTPLMVYNENDYQEVVDFCKDNGFDYKVDPVITYKDNGDSSPASLRVSNEKLNELVSSGIIHKQDINKTVKACEGLVCGFHIKSNGDVFPCVAFPYVVGNVYKDSIKDIWNSKKIKNIQEIKTCDLKQCNDCKYLKFCKRCPGIAWLESNDFYGCSISSKNIARALKYSNVGD